MQLTTYGPRLLQSIFNIFEDSAATRLVPSSGKSSPMSTALTPQARSLCLGFRAYGPYTGNLVFVKTRAFMVYPEVPRTQIMGF